MAARTISVALRIKLIKKSHLILLQINPHFHSEILLFPNSVERLGNELCTNIFRLASYCPIDSKAGFKHFTQSGSYQKLLEVLIV